MTPGKNVRYLCPQKLAVTEGENEPTDVFFRVLSPKRGVRIQVRDSEKTLSEAKRQRVNPGEMEHVRIRSDQITGDEVIVDAVKEEKA